MVKRLTDFISESKHHRLSYIEITIPNGYCPNGCCRPTPPIEKLLAVMRPAHVVIHGAIYEAEKEDMMSQLRESYQDYRDEHRRADYDEVPCKR
jgi:hypothetical protein